MRIIIAFAFIAVCAAQVPRPCLSPKQWEARRFRLDREKQFMEIAHHVYDEVNMRTHSIEEVEQGKERNFYSTIHLYRENKQYMVDLRTKKCNVSAITHPFRPIGVPLDAKFYFEVEVGPAQIPNEHLTSQIWGGKFTDGSEYIVSVTSPSCVPINFEVVNPKTEEQFSEVYYDLHGGITDPSVFIPPPECAGLEF